MRYLFFLFFLCVSSTSNFLRGNQLGLVVGHAQPLGSIKKESIAISAHFLPHPEKNYDTLASKQYSVPHLPDFFKQRAQAAVPLTLETPWSVSIIPYLKMLDTRFRFSEALSSSERCCLKKELPIPVFSFVFDWEEAEFGFDHFSRFHNYTKNFYLPITTLFFSEKSNCHPIKKINLFNQTLDYRINQSKIKKNSFIPSPFHTTLDHRFIIIANKIFWDALTIQKKERNILHYHEVNPRQDLSCFDRAIFFIEAFLLERESSNPITHYEADRMSQELLALIAPYSDQDKDQISPELFVVFMYQTVL